MIEPIGIWRRRTIVGEGLNKDFIHCESLVPNNADRSVDQTLCDNHCVKSEFLIDDEDSA